MNISSDKKNNRIAFYVAVGKILAMIVQFVMPLFLTRFLTKHDYGIYSQFYLVFGFLLSIFGMGIQSNLYYFYPKSRIDEQGRFVWGTYILILISGIIGCGLFMIPSVGQVIINNDYLEEYTFLIAACVFLGMPSLMIDPLSVVRSDKRLAVVFHPLEVICKILIVIAFALIFRSLSSILYGILLLEFLIFCFVFVYLIKNYRLSNDTFSFSLLKQQLIYSLPFGVAVVLNTLSGRFDKLLSVSFLTPEQYATYSIAFFGIPGIMQIYDSLCQVNVTNMAKLYKENDILGVKNEYKSFVVKTLSFSFPIILIVFVFTPQLIDLLFSEKYADAVPFFRIYILTFVIGMLGSGTILRAIDKTKLSMRAYFISVMITLPLSYWLIKTYGIWGAIGSAVLNTVVPKLFQIIFETRSINSSIKDYFPWKEIGIIVGFATGALFPIIILSHLMLLDIWAAIVISAIYVIALYWIYLRYDVFVVKPEVIKEYLQHIVSKIKRNA